MFHRLCKCNSENHLQVKPFNVSGDKYFNLLSYREKQKRHRPCWNGKGGVLWSLSRIGLEWGYNMEVNFFSFWCESIKTVRMKAGLGQNQMHVININPTFGQMVSSALFHLLKVVHTTSRSRLSQGLKRSRGWWLLLIPKLTNKLRWTWEPCPPPTPQISSIQFDKQIMFLSCWREGGLTSKLLKGRLFVSFVKRKPALNYF